MIVSEIQITGPGDTGVTNVASRSRGAEMAQTEPEPLAALLAATAKGDREAFAELYRLTSSRLLGIACKMTGDRELAEEILQEAFLTVWQKAGLYRDDLGMPLAWLTTIVRHRTIDRLRLTGGSREIPVGADAELDLLLAGKIGKLESEIVIEQSILRCLEGLKEKQQKFILLAFYHGLTHEELSARTETPLGTVKSDMRRGLASLKVCLER
ncbi:MAG: sigma-70 family RNA polymerase sigma factor [Hyphomicrobiales bacterium]|nr:sigma-70 family RNA polymerase sigma factor [Hyphomicrobiales bacterium]